MHSDGGTGGGFRKVPAPGASSLGPPVQPFQAASCSTDLHSLPYVPLHKICISAGNSHSFIHPSNINEGMTEIPGVGRDLKESKAVT